MEDAILKDKTNDDDNDEGEDDDEEAADMEAFEESGMLDDAQATTVLQKEDVTKQTAEDDDIIHTRTYDLHITYDRYYQTPRLWFTGYDEVITQYISPLIIRFKVLRHISRIKSH